MLIERDAVRAKECSDVLHKSLVLHGDASAQELLKDAGVGPDTAFVAISGLKAARNRKPRVTTRGSP